MLVPTFSGGTAVIGSTGVGSSDITASATSGGSYPTPALTSAKTYTLTVTSPQGTVVSTTCVVTPTPVTITPIVPANQTTAPGQLTFTATASGGLTNGLTWTASTGTFSGNVWTSPTVPGTYTITATSVDEPSVFVSTTSTISGPTITTQPVSQHVCTGSNIVLSVTASYASSYQWNFNGTPIPGATSSTYTISTAAAANAGNYTVTVTNGAASVTSAVATIAVGSQITSNPSSVTILPTQTASFSVAAQGIESVYLSVVPNSFRQRHRLRYSWRNVKHLHYAAGGHQLQRRSILCDGYGFLWNHSTHQYLRHANGNDGKCFAHHHHPAGWRKRRARRYHHV